MGLYEFHKNGRERGPEVCESIFQTRDDTHGRVDIELLNDTPGTVDRMRAKNRKNGRPKKADGRRIFEPEREKREKAENLKKIENKFEKGVAFFREMEYNVADVCKGDEVTDCSLAGEGTVMDHVRQSDDGSRSVMQGKSQASRT